MKSDREFLDGIYSKAAAYKANNEEIEHNKTFLKKMFHWLKIHRLQVSFATGLAFSAIALSVGYNQSMKQKVNPNIISSQDIGMENQRGIRVGEPAVAEYSVTGIDQKNTQGTTVAYGSVVNIYENESRNYVDVMVLKSDDETIVEQTITFLMTEQLMDDLYTGEKIIVELEKSKDTDYYELNDYKDNLYRFNEKNQDNTYTSVNGRSIREDEIKNFR